MQYNLLFKYVYIQGILQLASDTMLFISRPNSSLFQSKQIQKEEQRDQLAGLTEEIFSVCYTLPIFC
jgi:hypothetical protein